MEPPGSWGHSEEIQPVEMFGLAGFGQRLMGRIIDSLLNVIPAAAIFVVNNEVDSGRVVTFYGLLIVLTLLNDVVLTTIKGGTIGKLIVGTRVVRLPDRRPIDAGTAGRRWAAMTVLELIPFLGLADSLWIFTGKMRQTLHDKFAETIVVQKDRA